MGYLVYVGFMSQNTKVAKCLAEHGERKSISGVLARKLSSGYLDTKGLDDVPPAEPNFGEKSPAKSKGESTPKKDKDSKGKQPETQMESITVHNIFGDVKTVLDVEDKDDEHGPVKKCVNMTFKIIRLPYTILFNASMPPCLERAIPNYFFIWQFVWSVVWIALLTYVMILVSGRIGCILKIPSVVMGMVVISAGTTVPDCLSSIIVSRAGQGDMAVCNAIGSNIFNILIGLGLPWLLYTLVYAKPYESKALEGLQVLLSILILVLYLGILLLVLIISKWKLFPAVGAVLISLHLLFIAWALLTNPLGDGKPVINLE